jgi:hypothetical protein
MPEPGLIPDEWQGQERRGSQIETEVAPPRISRLSSERFI